MEKVNILWLRRDLRLFDQAALSSALHADLPVQVIFIFDRNILQELPVLDRRVDMIHQILQQIDQTLKTYGSRLLCFHDTPLEAFKKIVQQLNVQAVFANRDYEPYALQRDREIGEFLRTENISFLTSKDQVIFDQDEIVKDDGTPYTVYTPYSKKWKATIGDASLPSFSCPLNHSTLRQSSEPVAFPSLESLGFRKTEFVYQVPTFDIDLIKNYHLTRDRPSLHGTTKLSIHLRFGTVSIRSLVRMAIMTNEKFLNELIWRDFYQNLLWHFPHMVTRAFKKEYDEVMWRNDPAEFEVWCKGETGYLIVDAGMRELNATGWMHNRVRMIVASFLTKHLLIDWRWGEIYFAEKLLDFDLASNNGGWQWAAGSGADAAPYFRIFNPYLQTLKFDNDLAYIRKWVPEFESPAYPKPIVDHEFARNRCLAVYKKALKRDL